MKPNSWHTHTHTHNYKVLTHCFPNNLWCLCYGMELSVCVCVCVCVDPSWCLHVCLHPYVCVCVCVCVLPAGGWPGPPRKGDVWRLFGSGRGRLAHSSPLIFYTAALSSLIIFYAAAITNCLEQKGPPATAHAASSKPGTGTKQTRRGMLLVSNTATDWCGVNWVLLQ